jgi:hypothetical protein
MVLDHLKGPTSVVQNGFGAFIRVDVGPSQWFESRSDADGGVWDWFGSGLPAAEACSAMVLWVVEARRDDGWLDSAGREKRGMLGVKSNRVRWSRTEARSWRWLCDAEGIATEAGRKIAVWDLSRCGEVW